MKSPQFSMLFTLVLTAFFSFSWATLPHQSFLQCLSLRSNDSSISKLIFTRTNSSYGSVLDSTLWNLRFNSTNTPKPLVIVTPTQISHIQATIHCSRKHGLQTRTRSGGHDYEGLSSIAKVPFIIIDLVHFRSVDVDVENRIAWVQSGASLGELYYRIAEKSTKLAFPAAVFHTIGVGGHISGGGFGLLLRKYGLAADNVLDAQFIDVNGRVLDRKSMGEDLFWAIRGGGGGSFGIVLSWKLSLVPVPANVTVFSVTRVLEQNATEVVHRWQYIARDLPDEVYSTVILRGINSTQDGRKTVLAIFSSLFLGTINELLPLMEQRFPELGLTRQNCTEMSYIQSLMVNNGLPNQPLEILLNWTSRVPIVSPSYKAKSDYVKEPISVTGLNGLFSRLTDETAALTTIVFVAFGGIMDRIPENATPFPHRAEICTRSFMTWVGKKKTTYTPKDTSIGLEVLIVI
ncbi:FAD-binding Berberine family protein [Hibiscus syriacus]|uniref:FAD-binding Berberine family protein n=1 Tax=Hibiscus syriacus TaxID=106335 RepID=A0A6A2ZR71_HIBSY|nr:FAD-binding Berberine family protein [Hibiscus syriacus]